MSDNYGCIFAAIPELPDIDVQVDGGEHVTLAYFGDEALSEDWIDLIDEAASEVVSALNGPFEVDVLGLDYFGEEENAVVLLLDSSMLRDIRNAFLGSLPLEIYEYFKSKETYTHFRPHITLGYIDQGYVPLDDDLIPETVEFTSLAVWNGSDRVEIPLGELAHIGVIRRSGRYPWGSGENPHQRNQTLYSTIQDLQKQGMSDSEIVTGLGLSSTTELRAIRAIAKNQERKERVSQAEALKARGHSNTEIGRRMGINESSVRALLDPSIREKQSRLNTTADLLKEELEKNPYLDIGAGTENHLGVNPNILGTSVAMLKQEGYQVQYVKVPQLGTDKETTIKVLTKPGVTYSELYKNQDKISSISKYSEDNGRTFLGIEPPTSIDSRRVSVRYGDEGGSDMDGVIQLRRGVQDLSLGQARYAQVRIDVDGTHYLKGMAMYADDLPDGVDIRFNTNKSKKSDPKAAMKPLKDDDDNPFGSVVRQTHYIDSKGKRKLSPLNIVGTEDLEGDTVAGEEGGWSRWSKTLSSQMLSKQSPSLAKEQLALAFDLKKAEYDEIMALTNPTVKKRLLESFSDDLDSSASKLKAAGLPRTANHVILPINSLKDTEIYAPNYRQGEKVVLIRHPHGGKFEIPELTVNNRNPEANRLIKNAVDAVGINSKVAGRLSGADFDGDTVLVIPNNSGKVKTSPALSGLKNFDPQSSYKPYDGMRTIDGGYYDSKTGKVDYKGKKPKGNTKQNQMGQVSNLITDMTIKGATQSELARAVRHSMVVIDAEKHHLDYKQSALDNGIHDLKVKYQSTPSSTPGGKASLGASTLISRAKSEARVDERIERRASKGGRIDPKTGRIVYENTGRTYTDARGKVIKRLTTSTKMAETTDAFSLSSGTPMEAVYAEHANRLKNLANQSRKNLLVTKDIPYSKSAAKTYAPEVESLKKKLDLAMQNKPKERQAQLLANSIVKAKRQANPSMDGDELRKVKGQALTAARLRTGAHKQRVTLTPSEWDAIQAGAISKSRLSSILSNADLDRVKELAMPRENSVMSDAKMRRAKAMVARGYTQADIADALGVPTSTLHDALGRM